MAIRTISNAGGASNATTAWVEGILPTSEDDIVATATSGNLSVGSVYLYGRSLDLTNYAGILSQSQGWIVIGGTTVREDLVGILIPNTSVFATGLSVQLRNRTTTSVTIRVSGPKTMMLEFDEGPWELASSISVSLLRWYLGSSTFPTVFRSNGNTINAIQGIDTSGAAAAYLDNTTINIIDPTGTSGSIMFRDNFKLFSSNTTIIVDALTFQLGMGANVTMGDVSYVLKGGQGQYIINSSFTCKDFNLIPTASKNLNIYANKILTVTGDFNCFPKNGCVTFTGTGSVSKASGVVKLYSIANDLSPFIGGATWEAYHNCNFKAGLGVTNYGGILFCDVEGGSALNTGHGWWKVDYTLASGAQPLDGEIITGSTSGATAKIVGMVDTYEWKLGVGTLYFYAKVGVFQDETITFSGGSTMHVPGDFVNGAFSLNLNTYKFSIYDTIRFNKSPDPTAVGQNAQWTTCKALYGGGLPLSVAVTSSTNTTPIVVTKSLHGYVTNDVIFIYSHTGNLNANGYWIITKLTDDTYSLNDSVGSGVGSGGTSIQITSKCVVLTTPVTTNICSCKTSWTPGTNVSSAAIQSSYTRSEAYALSIVTGASCGANQILAKYGWATAIDLSNRKQISFWLRPQTSILAAAGSLLIKLYSDTACTVEVESLPIPAIQSNGYWLPITIDKGAFLSNTVRGVALYTTIAQPSKTFYMDTIIACKGVDEPDSINLQSLISKNDASKDYDDIFTGIQSIYGRIIVLDNSTNQLGTQGRGYSGVTELVPLFKRESSKIQQEVQYAISKGGTAVHNLVFQGGYDKITNLKEGLTILDGLSGYRFGFYSSYTYYTDFDNFQFVRFSTGFNGVPGYGTISNIFATNCDNGIYFGNSNNIINRVIALFSGTGTGINFAYACDFKSLNICIACNGMGSGMSLVGQAGTVAPAAQYIIANNNGQYGINVGSYTKGPLSIKQANYNVYGIYFSSNINTASVSLIEELCFNSYGIYFQTSNVLIKQILKANGNNIGVLFNSCNNIIEEILEMNDSGSWMIQMTIANNKVYKITGNNNKAFVAFASPNAINNYIYNAVLTNTKDDGTSISNDGYLPNYIINCTGVTSNHTKPSCTGQNNRLCIHGHNGDPNDHRIYSDGGYIFSDSVTRHSLTGIAWKLYLVDKNRNINFPLDLTIAKVICTAGKLTTIGLWVKKEHATDVVGRLIIQGGPYTGIGTAISDVYVDAADSTAWQQISMQFTPTRTEVIIIEFLAYWAFGSTSANQSIWIDDVTIIA